MRPGATIHIYSRTEAKRLLKERAVREGWKKEPVKDAARKIVNAVKDRVDLNPKHRKIRSIQNIPKPARTSVRKSGAGVKAEAKTTKKRAGK